MDTEFEAKFYPVDKKRFCQKLLQIGAKLIVPERKLRRVLVDSRTYPQIKCTYIRVRDEGNHVRLSAKIHAAADGRVSDQKELDVIVDSFEKTIEILQIMGFTPDHYQENLRETWKLNNIEIVIDTWPGLESYSEIEASSEDEVKNTAQKLGFDWGKKIITGVGNIMSEKYHLDLEVVDQMLRHITFEQNPFTDLPSYPIANTQTAYL